MSRIVLRHSSATFLLLSFVVAAGCGTDDAVGRAMDFMRRGDDYVAQKEFREAIIEYRNAIQLAPGSGQVHFKLGEAYEAEEDWGNALGSYTRAADLLPVSADAQLKAGSLLHRFGLYQDAEMRARAALRERPDDPAGLLLLANAQAGLNRLEEAIAANERALALDPTRPGLLINLGVLEYASGNTESAEDVLQRAIDLNPQSVSAHLALGKFYWLNGQPAKAEDAFLKALELDPKGMLANGAVAAFLIASGRGAEAESYVRAVADIAGSVEARLQVADYYVAMGQLESALHELDAIAGLPEGFADATVRKAVVEYIRGKRAAAATVLDTVLARDAKNATALAYKAQFLTAENRAPEALVVAKEAIAAEPRSKHGHFALGRAHQALGDFDEAKKAYNEVVGLDPQAVEAHIELAKLHVERKQIDTAIQYARQAVQAAPRSLDARLSLLRTLSVRPEDAERAEPVLIELLFTAGNSPEVQIVAGDIALARNRRLEARTSFEKALQLQPDSTEALSRLVNLDASEGRMSQARARLEEVVAKHATDPRLLLFAARFYGRHGDFHRAVPLFRRVVELDPSSFEAYTALGAIYVAEGRLGEARGEFLELARLQPRSIAPPTMIGLLYHVEGQQETAREYYERALTIDRRASTAANNLAWLLAEQGKDLDLALSLAQTAIAEKPNQPEIVDTLGWVYYKKDRLAMAIPLFQRALDVDSDNPLYHYHMGIALARQGLDAAARAALERALNLNPKFENADDARLALQALLY